MSEKDERTKLGVVLGAFMGGKETAESLLDERLWGSVEAKTNSIWPIVVSFSLNSTR